MQTSRRLLAVLFILLLSATFAAAHDPTPPPSPGGAGAQEQPASPAAPHAEAQQQQMPGMPMNSSDSSLMGHLKSPEYMHTLLNPMPVYGLSMGVLALIIGLVMRSRRVTIAALVLLFVAGLAAWPTYYYGEAAYDGVKAMSDPAGGLWLDEHMARAEKIIYAFYALAAVALAGILAPIRWPRSAMPLTIAALILGMGTLGIGGWIAYAGGHVRHQEFRFEPPPPPRAEHDEHGGKDAHGGEHEHGASHGGTAQGEQPKPMDHGSMPGIGAGSTGSQPTPMPSTPPDQQQTEASRLQLEASRLQLEASRKQLEAMPPATPANGMQMPASGASPTPSPTAPEHP